MRGLTVVALVVAGAAHVPVTPSHLVEAPYVGVAFIAFTVASLVLAVGLTRSDNAVLFRWTWLLCLAAIGAYAGTRVVAFPMIGDDVGNWMEPLGLISVGSELAALFGTTVVLRRVPEVARLAAAG